MAPTRPATISELAAAAATADADQGPPRELKHYLRQAELRRRDAKALAPGTGGSNGVGSGGTGAELERAFIEYARAATLILERIPNHRDYVRFLTQEQRENLTANGEDILHQLGLTLCLPTPVTLRLRPLSMPPLRPRRPTPTIPRTRRLRPHMPPPRRTHPARYPSPSRSPRPTRVSRRSPRRSRRASAARRRLCLPRAPPRVMVMGMVMGMEEEEEVVVV
ncbi:hypothetical protein B0H10DRAFT_1275957 [Mycena sp. CBHHK59/15]|nr:hypothetical protein B0H10DRAFT_1275957 [Mycena sp. CBHHK59/15]